MKSRLASLSVLAVLGLWCATQAYAQGNQSLQITAGPAVESVSGQTATITWSTNVPGSSTVKYGTDPNNLSQTAQESWGGTNHSVTLKDLEPGKTYFYQVASGQGLGTGTGAQSNVGQFTAGQQGSQQASQPTAGQSGAPTPEANISVLVGPIAQNVRDTSAQIAWGTNSASSTILKYGTDPNNLSQTAEKPWGAQQHQVQISNLQPNTTYYVSVQTEAGRELAKSQFRTLPSGATAQQFQITNGPVVESLGPDSAVIAWTTNAPSSSVVMYGTDARSMNQRAEAEWGQQTHRVTVKNLEPNTTYWFRVQSGQAQGTGQTAQSQAFPLRTEASGQSATTFKQQ